MYTFHEAVSHLQEMEEDVLDSHKLMLDQLPKWHQSCVTLLAMTNEVDYDVDGIPFFPSFFLFFYLIVPIAKFSRILISPLKDPINNSKNIFETTSADYG